jgi:hypothetical protein
MASARSRSILGRFPRHLEADAQGKVFGRVVDALAQDLDAVSYQLGRVRRSHRLGHADEGRDLALLAALHGLATEDARLLRLRLDALGELAGAGGDAAPQPPGGLLNLATEEWNADILAQFLDYRFELALLRRRIRACIDLHRQGNGTVSALLGGAANALDLDLTDLLHLSDGYWHIARCEDRFRVSGQEVPPDPLALEENPERRKEKEHVAYRHAQRFSFLRGGFEPVPVSVVVKGIGDRTVQPMVVHLDSGVGLSYRGKVPDGNELVFGSDGRVTLDGEPAGRLSYSFRGAVFADGDGHPGDFVLADADSDTATDRDGLFAVTRPLSDAFEPSALWPHAGGLLEAPELLVGDNRWAFFVRVGHAGTLDQDQNGVPAVPLFNAALFDMAVLGAGSEETPRTAGAVGFLWNEREPFAVRVWLPSRFRALDREGELTVRERVRLVLERYRAAGIHVYTEYADERWTLEEGSLPAEGEEQALRDFVLGTRLWSDDTTQPAAP